MHNRSKTPHRVHGSVGSDVAIAIASELEVGHLRGVRFMARKTRDETQARCPGVLSQPARWSRVCIGPF
jgi:hypothetical protein